jgi:hypothetical protein
MERIKELAKEIDFKVETLVVEVIKLDMKDVDRHSLLITEAHSILSSVRRFLADFEKFG